MIYHHCGRQMLQHHSWLPLLHNQLFYRHVVQVTRPYLHTPGLWTYLMSRLVEQCWNGEEDSLPEMKHSVKSKNKSQPITVAIGQHTGPRMFTHDQARTEPSWSKSDYTGPDRNQTILEQAQLHRTSPVRDQWEFLPVVHVQSARHGNLMFLKWHCSLFVVTHETYFLCEWDRRFMMCDFICKLPTS